MDPTQVKPMLFKGQLYFRFLTCEQTLAKGKEPRLY